MRKLLALLLAASCSLCFADDGAERRAAASQLVELLGVAESNLKPAANCLPNDSQVAGTLRSFYEKHPEKFDGITPQSAYWPDYERIYKRYLEESCLFSVPDMIVAAYANALAEKVSLPELQAAITFYSTPEGQRFARQSLLASQKTCADLKEVQAAVLAYARANYRDGFRKLKERYKAEPK